VDGLGCIVVLGDLVVRGRGTTFLTTLNNNCSHRSRSFNSLDGPLGLEFTCLQEEWRSPARECSLGITAVLWSQISFYKQLGQESGSLRVDAVANSA
jgi:hypothetical protein